MRRIVVLRPVLLVLPWFCALLLRPAYGQQTGTSHNAHMEQEGNAEFKRQREAWLEGMHRAEPGVNWRILDREVRRSHVAERLRMQAAGKTRSDEVTVGGVLTGRWTERGSNNLAGRIHLAAADFERGYLYAASAGGNIWRGTLDGEGWTCLNNSFRIRDIRSLFVIRSPAGGKRLVVVGNAPAQVWYTDDEGATWHLSDGLQRPADWGWLKRGVLDRDGVLYVLAFEWSSNTWRQITTLYRSTDGGATFEAIHHVGLDVSQVDVWSSATDVSGAYLLKADTLLTLGADGTAHTLSAGFVDGFDQSWGRTVLQGQLHEGTFWFYALHHTLAGLRLYRSVDGGTSWTSTGSRDFDLFDYNSFAVSPDDPNVVFVGGIEVHRSTDGGVTWPAEPLYYWGDYYRSPETQLHADIPGIQFARTPEGTAMALVSTDGGLYTSVDALASVRNVSLSGLGVSQYYDTYTPPGAPHLILAGSQDQGYQRAAPNEEGVLDFTQVISGDYGHLSSGDGERVWMTYPGFVLYATVDGDSLGFWSLPANGRLWMPPVAANPMAPRTALVAGGSSSSASHLWRLSVDGPEIKGAQHAYDFNVDGDYAYVSAIAISPLDTSYWYVATSYGNYFYSTDAGVTWKKNAQFDLPISHYFYGTAVLPSAAVPGRVYIAGSGYSNAPVFRSDDHGATFEPMDTGLPRTLVYDLAATPDESLLFAATEVGPYVYVAAHGRWYHLAGLAAPDQTYWSVEFVPAINTARFGTYGRGIWDFSIRQVTVDIEPEPLPRPAEVHIDVYPNPATSEATVSFELPQAAEGTLKIYDVTGRVVDVLFSGVLRSGPHRFTWRAGAPGGSERASGIYLCVLNTELGVQYVKIVVAK